MGCFAMTELGHGSNVFALETTATYDPTFEKFILNTPTQTAMKFWVGHLGKTASKACVFAQLYVEGENQGVHIFLIDIRDPQTHEPYDGILVGDCGHKIGCDGVDNGWIMFNNYHVA